MELVINSKKEYLRRWRSKSRRYLALQQAKWRSKRDSIKFDLSLEDIPEVPTSCPILGIPLIHHEGIPGWHDDSPSLDRIYPDKGYVKDNIRFISNRANRIKFNATVEELEKIFLDALNHRCRGECFRGP
jgi:hypothetical protein